MHRLAPQPKRLTRMIVRSLLVIGLAFLGLVALIYFKQHSMIYHPRPYDLSYAQSLPADGEEISYALPFGKQTAFYIPAHNNVRRPERVWMAFCGNASLALDWTTILAGYPHGDDAFLLIDYPGYGKCQGDASIPSMRASSDAALKMLAKRLGLSGEELELRLCTIGHSLGSAVALDFAARHHVQRVVAISAFTTLREEAARIVGGPLSHLLVENYDNRPVSSRSTNEVRKCELRSSTALATGSFRYGWGASWRENFRLSISFQSRAPITSAYCRKRTTKSFVG
jgi:uncharacterized protein